VNRIHDASDVALQVHSRVAVMAIDPLPPAEPKLDCPVLEEIWHFDVVGARTEVEEAVHLMESSDATAATAVAYRRARGLISPDPGRADARASPHPRDRVEI
jgi:hypothetical protein